MLRVVCLYVQIAKEELQSDADLSENEIVVEVNRVYVLHTPAN